MAVYPAIYCLLELVMAANPSVYCLLEVVMAVLYPAICCLLVRGGNGGISIRLQSP